MLTTYQMEAILRRAGAEVPDFPPEFGLARSRTTTTASREAIEQWAATIETLFVEYVARRAAKSLRDAEETRQLSELQRAG